MIRRPPHAGATGLQRFVWAGVLSALAATTAITVEARRAAPLPCGLDLKVLVLSADGSEPVLPSITQTLDYLGTPYQLHVGTRDGAITPEFLKSGCRGFFQGILQTSPALVYHDGTNYVSALSAAESEALLAYATAFDVRQVNLYAFPTADVGLFFTAAVGTSDTPLPIVVTPTGKSVFPYLSIAAAPPHTALSGLFPPLPAGLSITHSWTYLATPTDAATVPVLTTAAGDVLAAIRNHSDGREVLTLTFDGSPHLTHSIALGYGLVNWVTRGVFIGERRVYMSPQVDDLLIANDRPDRATPCGVPVEGTGSEIRMTGQDLLATVAWQRIRRLLPTTKSLRLTMAYNGYGADKNVYRKDTLTPAVKSLQGDFYWVSHTFTHPNLDAPVDYYTTLDELQRNQKTAKTLKFTLYSAMNLVTPEVSGLDNPEAMRAVHAAGGRYIVSDTSRAGHTNPFPNVGIVNPHVPGVYAIPRRPTNLYTSVATPAQWLEDYNCAYTTFWGRPLTYAEILDKESQHLVTYMARGEMNPWMFHQPNLVFYDRVHSVLTDLLDVTIAKYEAIYNLPILSPAMDEVGRRMQARAALRAAGVSAFRAPDGAVTLAAARAAVVPVTGLALTGAEVYGGQPTAFVKVAAGRAVVVRPR